MIKPSASWWLSNICLLAFSYVGFVFGVRWIGIAVSTFIWITLAMYLLVLLSPDSVMKYRNKPLPVSRSVGWLVDIVIFGFLIWGEAFITSTVYIGSCLVLEAIYGPANSNNALPDQHR